MSGALNFGCIDEEGYEFEIDKIVILIGPNNVGKSTVFDAYEAIRQWCRTIGLDYARRLRCRRGRMGDRWYLDELFGKIQGRQQYLWRAGDEDGDLIDILVQSRRNRRAATRFFRKLSKRQGREPRRLITDKLRSYAGAHRAMMPSVIHSTRQYENNRTRSLINRSVSGSARCAGSSRPPLCNALRRCTASYKASSGSADICSALFTTVC